MSLLMEEALETSETEDQGDDLCHIYCVVCTPEPNPISHCGIDLTSHIEMEDSPEEEECIVCVDLDPAHDNCKDNGSDANDDESSSFRYETGLTDWQKQLMKQLFNRTNS